MADTPSQPSLLDPVFGDTSPHLKKWSGIAKVCIDSPLPHLDRLFDYGIPAAMSDTAQIGARVRVRFTGRLTDGYIIDTHGYSGEDVQPLRRVVGDLPVVTSEVLKLCQEVAARYAGGLADVLRLAIPPRHAATETEVSSSPLTPTALMDIWAGKNEWESYIAGEAFLRRLGNGESPRAVWSALPHLDDDQTPHWARAIAQATHAVLTSNRGVVIVVPTQEDLNHLEHALEQIQVPFSCLTAEMGPSARYKNFLHALTGRSMVVIGTRSAAYAPVLNLGLVVCWDEAHDAHNEPRSPYAHVRETLSLRATASGAAALIGGYARTPAAQNLVGSGWAHHLAAPRAAVREQTPRIRIQSEYDREREGGVGHARIPGFAWSTIKKTLETGPVLIQVPRAGFIPGVACSSCRKSARCPNCNGPLAASELRTITCTWCGRSPQDWQCSNCQNRSWRAIQIGAQRTAEELGRGFPGVPIKVSGRGPGKLDLIPEQPALVVATPGAEPPAKGGYPLSVLLDGELLTNLPFLSSQISAVHRWMRAAALTKGEVLILGNPLPAPAQALVRWDPAGFATRELIEWTDLGFPPARTVISITGERPDLIGLTHLLPEDANMRILGPVEFGSHVSPPSEGELGITLNMPQMRLLVSAPAHQHHFLAQAVRSAVRIRSARRDGGPVKVKVNPIDEL